MILAGDFYKVLSVVNGDALDVVLEINAGHGIFNGHFPGQPVVPGVCMMQMVKEMMESATGKVFRLVNGNDAKFLSVIDPRKNNIVHSHIIYAVNTAGIFHVTARLYFNETTFFKFKGHFTEA